MDWNSFVLGAGAVFGAVATLLFCVCQKRAGRQDAPKGASHDGSCRRATIAESDQAAARVIATALEARDAELASLRTMLEASRRNCRTRDDQIDARDARIAELEGALEPFVRHGTACGAFGGDPGPFWIMTNEGHRDVPPVDFNRARAILTKGNTHA